MSSENKKNIFKAKSILAYLIAIITVFVIVVVSNYVQIIESVFIQRAILGVILFIGYASAACLLITPYPPMERGEI